LQPACRRSRHRSLDKAAGHRPNPFLSGTAKWDGSMGWVRSFLSARACSRLDKSEFPKLDPLKPGLSKPDSRKIDSA